MTTLVYPWQHRVMTTTRADFTYAVKETLTDFQDEYNVEALVQELIDTFGLIDPDHIPEEAFWEIVPKHDRLFVPTQYLVLVPFRQGRQLAKLLPSVYPAAIVGPRSTLITAAALRYLDELPVTREGTYNGTAVRLGQLLFPVYPAARAQA